jgi:hypothetical protein
MNANLVKPGRVLLVTVTCAIGLILVVPARAQTKSYERPFPQSRSEIQEAIKKMQFVLSGHLPVLEGFADPADRLLDHYSRGYYQAVVQVTAKPDGSSVVRVVAKVTAWYTDPAAARSGYQLLVSNGRIESDLLDQLADQLAASPGGNDGETLAAKTEPASAPVSVPANKPVTVPASTPAATVIATAAPKSSGASRSIESPSTGSPVSGNEPGISAPSPQFPPGQTPSSSLSQGLASSLEHSGESSMDRKTNSALLAEIDSLSEVIKNQAHPKNLVAVKKAGTPVVSSPSLTAKPDFFADKYDEFELLNFNADWVHVRISGLSRGWIWRSSVEMPEGIPDTGAGPSAAMTPVADLFHVTREETAQFPGDWAPLRGKNVKILTVERIDDSANKDVQSGDTVRERLNYTRSLLEKTYGELAANSKGLAGIVVIFDSADGGMIAADIATLQEWKTGALSDSALWHKCFFDPPELLDSSTSARSQGQN